MIFKAIQIFETQNVNTTRKAVKYYAEKISLTFQKVTFSFTLRLKEIRYCFPSLGIAIHLVATCF